MDTFTKYDDFYPEFRQDWDCDDFLIPENELLTVYDESGALLALVAGVPFQGSATAGAHAPLYTAHISEISDNVLLYKGASYLKVTTSHYPLGSGSRVRGVRGAVKCFSRASRRRLMQTVAKVRRDLQPLFVTLTYPDEFSSDVRVFKKDFHKFLELLKYHFPDASAVWKLEPQRRGAPHFHLLVWGVGENDFNHSKKLVFRDWVVSAWVGRVKSSDVNHRLFHEGKLRNSEHCVKKIPLGSAGKYVSKYMSKSLEFSVEDWGRWWGVHNWEMFKKVLGDMLVLPVTHADAIQIIRYLRRFMGIKSRQYRSLTGLVNADRWLSCMLW